MNATWTTTTWTTTTWTTKGSRAVVNLACPGRDARGFYFFGSPSGNTTRAPSVPPLPAHSLQSGPEQSNQRSAGPEWDQSDPGPYYTKQKKEEPKMTKEFKNTSLTVRPAGKKETTREVITTDAVGRKVRELHADFFEMSLIKTERDGAETFRVHYRWPCSVAKANEWASISSFTVWNVRGDVVKAVQSERDPHAVYVDLANVEVVPVNPMARFGGVGTVFVQNPRDNAAQKVTGVNAEVLAALAKALGVTEVAKVAASKTVETSAETEAKPAETTAEQPKTAETTAETAAEQPQTPPEVKVGATL